MILKNLFSDLFLKTDFKCRFSPGSKWLALSLSLFCFSFGSCSDDLQSPQTDEPENVENLPDINPNNALVVNFSLNPGQLGVSTRDTEKGTPSDHEMDFDTDHECFGIFFDSAGRYLSIKRLYKHTSLGNGTVPTDPKSEYEVNVMAYFGVPEGYADMTPEQQAYNDSVPSRVLVVINGGRIYDRLFSELGIQTSFNEERDAEGKIISRKSSLTEDNFLNFQWLSSYSKEASNNGDAVIGINNRGRFTMTNSAYYNEDGKLMTVAEIERSKVYPSFVANIKPENSAATIYVERMVAKFSAPKFDTEVIGSRRVFRPSQTAEPVVIYSWSGNNLRSVETDWRIHVLGWTINGREKANYLFKHIKQAYEDGLYGWESWNDPQNYRSYWSIDPHYDQVWNGDTGTGDYYPWQYRYAIDNRGISLSMHPSEAALRYLSFNEAKYWDENTLTISENTFDPDKYPSNSGEVLDHRATLLAGPHLLVTAEIYLESADATEEDYLGQFKTVPHLYSDRLRRFYFSEMDWFRMFVREFDHALRTQENMTFHYYNWNLENVGQGTGGECKVTPTGDCALLFDLDLLEASLENVPEDEWSEAAKILLDPKHKEEFNLKPVSEVIDLLITYKVPVSALATVKDGDGRLIPWIDGLVFRNRLQPSKILKVTDASGNEFSAWNDDMRKSLIFEWFGAVDHYLNGYMYYAADIPHHVPEGSTGTTFYGTVRNHWYSFKVKSINSLGNPIDDPNQPIIPARFNYRDQIGVYVEIKSMHPMSSNVEFE